jgi:hypothetical protein
MQDMAKIFDRRISSRKKDH